MDLVAEFDTRVQILGAGPMNEPTRHSASVRNRRKALHNAKALKDEVEFLHSDATKRLVNLQYALHRVCRLVNRLEAEVQADEKGGD